MKRFWTLVLCAFSSICRRSEGGAFDRVLLVELQLGVDLLALLLQFGQPLLGGLDHHVDLGQRLRRSSSCTARLG